ncbi:MAG TPA: FliA/WhiG family RNA polymerase sigma factor [Solirubrobacteraceae bacterium]|nr:FliA/WhiG family RNA polymerase sigma factor [Solirubrobacteraceae bacterium]
MTRVRSERASSESVQQLWEQYNATGAAGLRDRLVLTLAPMVKYIVYRKAREIPARCEVEDFVSCGIEALMRSIDRYDPARGATLEQFAWTRIHGAVLDELRRNDWAPRSLRRWERDISRAREKFIALYGRAPSQQELADAVSLTPSQLDKWLGDIHRSDVGSLNVLVLGDDDTTIERIDTLSSHDANLDPEQRAVRDHAKERFRAAFEQLPERERQVAVRLYLHNMTLREIGDALGVTESRVCQIHSQLRKRLRELLAEDEQLFQEVA